MFRIQNAYATIWGATREEKRTKVRLSTSDKDRDGNKQYSNWNATFVGKAHDQIASIIPELEASAEAAKNGGKRQSFPITIVSGKVVNTRYEAKDKDGKPVQRDYLDVVVFDYEMSNFIGSTTSSAPATHMPTSPTVEDDSDDMLPF